jgi:hypothetical protein
MFKSKLITNKQQCKGLKVKDNTFNNWLKVLMMMKSKNLKIWRGRVN